MGLKGMYDEGKSLLYEMFVKKVVIVCSDRLLQ